MALDHEPRDRLTRIGDRLLTLAAEDPEFEEGDKILIMAESANQRGGIAASGYEDGNEIFVDLFYRLHVIAQANAMRLEFMPLEQRGQG